MPGPYIHISWMWHAAEQLQGGYKPVASDRINPDRTGDSVADLGAIMDENPNYAAIGTVAPDLCFFLPGARRRLFDRLDRAARHVTKASTACGPKGSMRIL